MRKTCLGGSEKARLKTTQDFSKTPYRQAIFIAKATNFGAQALPKATYNKAVARGETAGLLEQLPEASDAFSTNLGNIPAGGKGLVEITYVGELKHDAEVDGMRWTLPTKIVPRYGDVPEALGRVRCQEEGGISITVDVDVGETSQIQSLKSPSHPVAVTIGNTSKTKGYPKWYRGSATIALENAQLDKDFVFLFSNKVIGNPTAFLETHPAIRN
ncbi:hypothetical protein OEA41_005195 [Lepraria neglecta]|uniref:VIT domain-containing protein n=1 Tax=Lepraria neglecta TaxID=209136 RepID=A0AAE0DFB6_9LECA|nr:hypothetical protein OEA41_005195 [Lepraria neglecta]